ncbi:unnamed protein product, partial [Acanthocheilonema viteae]
MSLKTASEVPSKSINIENAYATINYRKKASDGGDMPKYATLSKIRKSTKFERLTSNRKREWIESGAEHGFIRLYAPTGSRSLIYPVTLQTTVQDICSIL